MNNFKHIPVMIDAAVNGLNVKDGGVYFDGTVGSGADSYRILEMSSPNGRLIATDLDDDAISFATERLKPFEGRYKIYKSNYKNFEAVLNAEGIEELDGVLLDFGVSSHQIDEESRGFSYMKPNAPLDMRLDQTAELKAEDIVNNYSEKEIAFILKTYGEEKFANTIARNIVAERQKEYINTAGKLVNIIEKSIPAKFRQNGPCARKSFQAIRIAVNGEIDGLYECVIGLTRKLKHGGRISILTFHSIEDRIVKQAFKELETDCICPKSFPVCVCGKRKEIEVITKKPVIPSEEEMTTNSRSRCAKLRIAEKL